MSGINSRMRVRTDLHNSMRIEAGRGDTQTGIAFGVASGGLLVAATSNAVDRLPPAGQILWWAGIACGLAAAYLLGAVIYPTIPTVHGPPAAVFHAWDVLAADRHGTLDQAFDATPTALGEAETQAVAIARLVDRKFRRVRRGLQALAAAAGLIVLAVLTGQL